MLGLAVMTEWVRNLSLAAIQSILLSSRFGRLDLVNSVAVSTDTCTVEELSD